MEPQWNPAIEEQALARVYRLGQTQPVVTVRFYIKESIEEVRSTFVLATIRCISLTSSLPLVRPRSPNGEDGTGWHAFVKRSRQRAKQSQGMLAPTTITFLDRLMNREGTAEHSLIERTLRSHVEQSDLCRNQVQHKISKSFSGTCETRCYGIYAIYRLSHYTFFPWYKLRMLLKGAIEKSYTRESRLRVGRSTACSTRISQQPPIHYAVDNRAILASPASLSISSLY